MPLKRGSQGFPEQPGFPAQMNGSPGALRDTLGSGMKARGIFQKDGQINNFRGGFIGAKNNGPYPNQGFNGQNPVGPGLFGQGYPSATGQGYPSTAGQGYPSAAGQGYPPAAGQMVAGRSRQLILQAGQPNFPGNGIATITPDNTVNVVANLPDPNNFGQGHASYVAYLVDEKGKTGFPVGQLRSVGNGVYQTSFRSQVPLHFFNKAIVTVENGMQPGQYPSGPIVLKVKEGVLGGAGAFLSPIGRGAKSVWGKVTGFVTKRGKKVGDVIPEAAVDPEFVQSLQNMGVNPDGGLPPQ